MKEAANIILVILLFYPTVKCQDIFSLVSPFLGSGVGGAGSGAGSAGSTGSLIQEFIKLGTDIGQQLLQAHAAKAKPAPPPIPSLRPAPPLPIPAPSPPIPTPRVVTTWPVMTTTMTVATTSLRPVTMHPRMGGDEDYDLVVGDLLGTTRAPPLPPSRFLSDAHNVQRAQAFAIPQQQFSGQQPHQQQPQQQRQHFVPVQHSVHFQQNARPQYIPQQQFFFRAPSQRQPGAFDLQAAVPQYNDAIKQATGFGQDVIRLLGEITQYSDVHRQQDQDYGSVQKLLSAFFQAMSPGQNDNGRAQQLQPIYDGTETGRNRPISRNLFESDIVLTVDQLKGIVLAEREKRRSKSRRTKRKVITGSVYRWPKDQPIPYEFASSDEKWRKTIRSALAFWEHETCVRWQENGAGYDRVVFFRGSGCYSSVGRTGGRQEISIGYGCEDLGIVTHEVGHSLGFWHEQSRPDRDQYIKLRNEYIARGTEGNFVKRSDLESDSMGVPFDLGSVMHYGPNAFTIDWDHATIETVDRKYSHTIGQRYGPSFIDIKQVNRLYCNDKCAGASLTCQHGGYADPNNCFSCKCPTGLGGPTCASVQPSNCGAELMATSSWQQLVYKGSKKCYWRIRADNARIRLVVESARFLCETTCQAYVEIKHNSDFQQTGFRKCCGEEEIEVLSQQAEALVIFDASELGRDGSFSLRYIQDSGKPLPKPPPPVWVPGSENRLFRGLQIGNGGPIEKFILNSIPKIRDPQRPAESIASIVTEFTLGQILG